MEKEVFFEKYCKTCEYAQCGEDEEHCFECLQHPSNEDSHKPVMYKEAENGGKREGCRQVQKRRD